MATKSMAVSEIQDGMLLAADAMGPEGNVLLTRGTMLSSRHKGMLEKRGIQEVLIQVGEAEPEEDAGFGAPAEEALVEEKSAQAQAVRERLEVVFAKVRGDESMEILLGLARERAGRIRL